MPLSREALVERRLAEWRARRAERTPPERPRPLITVTSHYGARGDELGRALAERLELQLYDRELTTLVAERARVDPALVEAREHDDADYLAMTLSAWARWELADDEYTQRLREVLALIAAQGGAVVMGRGANHAFGAEGAFRVLCTAPAADRAARLAERLDLPREEAEQRMLREDRRRARWVREHWGGAFDDPAAYDLVINTARIPLARAADLVRLALS